MKAYGTSGCIDRHFLDLGASWRLMAKFMSRPLHPWGKSRRYPLDTRLGGPQSRSGCRGEEKIIDPTGSRTPTPRSLYRLRYAGSYECFAYEDKTCKSGKFCPSGGTMYRFFAPKQEPNTALSSRRRLPKSNGPFRETWLNKTKLTSVRNDTTWEINFMKNAVTWSHIQESSQIYSFFFTVHPRTFWYECHGQPNIAIITIH
jgi:hypothetical protein